MFDTREQAVEAHAKIAISLLHKTQECLKARKLDEALEFLQEAQDHAGAAHTNAMQTDSTKARLRAIEVWQKQIHGHETVGSAFVELEQDDDEYAEQLDWAAEAHDAIADLSATRPR